MGAAALIPGGTGFDIKSDSSLRYFNRSGSGPSFEVSKNGTVKASSLGKSEDKIQKGYFGSLDADSLGSVSSPVDRVSSQISDLTATDAVYGIGSNDNWKEAFMISDYSDGGAAIQAALDAVGAHGGGRVLLSPITYKTSSTIDIPAKTYLRGAGIKTKIKLEDGANTDVVSSSSDWAGIEYLWINGNKSNNSSGSGIHLKGSTYQQRIETVNVTDCADHGITASNVDGRVLEADLRNIQSSDNGSIGFNLKSTGDLYSEHCYAQNNGSDGFVDDTGYNTYIHPHAYSNRTGFNLLEFADRVQIVSPHMETNNRRGMLIKGNEVLIRDPVCYRNSQESAGGFAAIQIEDASDVIISGGVAVDDSGSPTQKAAVELTTDPTDIVIENIISRGNTSGDVIGTGTRIVRNGWGKNNGDPSTTGQWNGEGYEGASVVDTSNSQKYVYRDGSWI